jgi:hypothetical protein
VSRDRSPAAQFPRQTFAELSAALGIHRNSCTAWASEGAPAGPPYCELAWRTWAAAHGKTVSVAPEQALLELLAGAGIPEYRRQLEQQRGQSSTPSVAPPDDARARKERAEAELRELELAKAKRLVVPVDELHRLVEAIAACAATVFDDAPGLVDELTLGTDDRDRVRARLVELLRDRRARLCAEIETRLRQALERPR